MTYKYYYNDMLRYKLTEEEEIQALGIKPDDYIDLSNYTNPILLVNIKWFIDCRGLRVKLGELQKELFYIEWLGKFIHECRPEMIEFLEQDQAGILIEMIRTNQCYIVQCDGILKMLLKSLI